MFPHAVNYGVVWRNVEDVLECMGPVLGEDSDTNPSVLYAIPPFRRAPFGNTPCRKRTSNLGSASSIVLRFHQIGCHFVLCGLTIDNTTTGCIGATRVNVEARGLCGLRLISDDDGCIQNVQCKYGRIWDQSRCDQHPELSSEGAVFTGLNWDTGDDVCFVLALDVSVLIRIPYSKEINAC